MTSEAIVLELRARPSERGRVMGVSFDVGDHFRPEGEWTQFFVIERAAGRRAFARQVIADVESELSQEAGREILLLVTSIEDPADALVREDPTPCDA